MDSHIKCISYFNLHSAILDLATIYCCDFVTFGTDDMGQPTLDIENVKCQGLAP
jgi:hypothetical protein